MPPQRGHAEIMACLLQARADHNAADQVGYTSLQLASQYGHPEIVKRLLEARADQNAAEQVG